MRQTFIVAVVAICSVVAYARAQNEPSTYTVRLSGGDVSIKANGRELRGDGSTFTNGVVLVVNGVRVTADRAAFHAPDFGDNRATEIELEGTVRLSLLSRP